MKEAIYHTAKRVGQDHMYTIGDRKYQRQKDKWEIIETFNYSAPREAVDDPPEDKESILRKIEEFTKTDIEVGFKPAEEYEYHELKEEVKKLGIEISGNPKRVELETLYKEATG